MDDRFITVARWKQKHGEEVLFRKDRLKTPLRWCVQYRGCGHYFATPGEAIEYCEKRKFNIDAYS